MLQPRRRFEDRKSTALRYIIHDLNSSRTVFVPKMRPLVRGLESRSKFCENIVSGYQHCKYCKWGIAKVDSRRISRDGQQLMLHRVCLRLSTSFTFSNPRSRKQAHIYALELFLFFMEICQTDDAMILLIRQGVL